MTKSATKSATKVRVKKKTSHSSLELQSSVGLKPKPSAKLFTYHGPVLAIRTDREDCVLIPGQNLSLTDRQLAHVHSLLASGHLVPVPTEVEPIL